MSNRTSLKQKTDTIHLLVRLGLSVRPVYRPVLLIKDSSAGVTLLAAYIRLVLY